MAQESDGRVVIMFKDPARARSLDTGVLPGVRAADAQRALEVVTAMGGEVLRYFGMLGAAEVRIDPAVLPRLREHPLVDFIEPSTVFTADMDSETELNPWPEYTLADDIYHWGINMVRAPDVWSQFNERGANASVYVVDTGYYRAHEDLPQVPNYNCLGSYNLAYEAWASKSCTDEKYSWHGTRVTGIIAARQNYKGTIGVAPGIEPYHLIEWRACGRSPSTGTVDCFWPNITDAINDAIYYGAHAINLSIGSTDYPAQSTVQAIQRAYGEAQIVLVAAAGNGGQSTVEYPGALAEVIAVSGVRKDKTRATSSSTSYEGCRTLSDYGSGVDIAAPFEAYTTKGPDDQNSSIYTTRCSTSMATAYVTGVVALLRSKYYFAKASDVVQRLYSTAEDIGAAGKDIYFGHGLVNAYNALAAGPPPSAPPEPGCADPIQVYCDPY
jgi:subtilisin family serine protease